MLFKLEELNTFIGKYVPANVYNMDETGLFYKMLPN